MNKNNPTILSITGSDSMGGSGIQADIKTITALGAYAATAITTVTAQNREGIQQLHDLSADVLEQQIQVVINDLRPDAIKVGMLRSSEQVAVVERILKTHRPNYVVIDPVVISSRGNRLMEREVAEAMLGRLFKLSTVVVIKQDSASHLVGGTPARSNEDMEQTVRALLEWGPHAVLLQGGAIATESLTDLLIESSTGEPHFFTRPGFIDRNTHGVGGAFSSAVAVFLSKGLRTEEAVERAQEYMNQLILRSIDSHSRRGTQLLNHANPNPQPIISPRLLELYNHLMNEIAMNHHRTADVSFYASQLNVSPRYLAQVTHRVAGRTPKQLIDDYIINEIEAQLLGTSKNIQEIAFDFGFSSQAQFNKFFRKMRSCTPTDFRIQR